MRGTQNPQAVEDGAQEFRQRNSRPLSRPSPSANLAGIWKGDPLAPQVRDHGHPDVNVLCPRTAITRAPAQPHRSWVMTSNVMFALSWFGFAWYWHVLALAFLVVVSGLV